MNEVKKLKKKIRELEESLEKEKREKEKIVSEKEKIEKEFEEFKAQHAVTVDNLKKALNIKADKKPRSKPLGAKNGHEGYSRHIPERIDYIKPHIPKKCPDCNTNLILKFSII